MPDAHVLVKDRSTPPPVRRVLTVHERESLQKAAAVYGYADAASDSYPEGARGFGAVQAPWLRVNRPRLNEQQQQVLKTLKEGTPEPVAPEDRDRIVKRCAELKEGFLQYHQTREEVHVKRRDNPAFFKATEKAQLWQRHRLKDGRTPEQWADEYRNLMRRLEPENPDADSLDRLRETK